MDADEMLAAANALVRWFASQGISADDAVPVMCVAINGAVLMKCNGDAKEHRRGLAIVTQMLAEMRQP